ncbi:hypothetical protein [Chromobacterium amazonense]|nr:hypothetical protein [Chromobacterium amazonense]
MRLALENGSLLAARVPSYRCPQPGQTVARQEKGAATCFAAPNG